MKRLLPVIFSFTLLTVYGQESDSVEVGKKPIIPRIYWDYGKTALAWSNFETKTELGLELLFFEKIQLIGEIGIATINPWRGPPAGGCA